MIMLTLLFATPAPHARWQWLFIPYAILEFGGGIFVWWRASDAMTVFIWSNWVLFGLTWMLYGYQVSVESSWSSP
jgi:hypothetical protein